MSQWDENATSYKGISNIGDGNKSGQQFADADKAPVQLDKSNAHFGPEDCASGKVSKTIFVDVCNADRGKES